MRFVVRMTPTEYSAKAAHKKERDGGFLPPSRLGRFSSKITRWGMLIVADQASDAANCGRWRSPHRRLRQALQ
jgi:hypothetical protein